MREPEVRNPYHPRALVASELFPNRRIARVNTAEGTYRFYTVLDHPHEEDRGGYTTWVVSLRDDETRNIRTHTLGDLGVIPYNQETGWNDRNFVLDPDDLHTLPTGR